MEEKDQYLMHTPERREESERASERERERELEDGELVIGERDKDIFVFSSTFKESLTLLIHH